jgi:Flp pilus assembly protein TadG
MQRIIRKFIRLLREQEAVALIEFAMVFPFFMLLLLGGIEISRLILIQQKLEKAGYVIADITSQYKPATLASAAGEISHAELTTNVFPILSRIMGPYANLTNQVVILTSVRKPVLGNMSIAWQVAGGGTLNGCDTLAPPNCAVSVVNGKSPAQITSDGLALRGTVPAFPADINTILTGFVPTPGAGNVNFIVSEVFYFYQPLLMTQLQSIGTAGGSGMMGFNYFIPPRIYVKRTYFVPREIRIYDLPPTFPCCT